MNITKSLAYCALVFPALVSTGKLEAATSVFSENFSTSTMAAMANPYYGGYYGSQIPALKWAGSSDSAGISSGTLNVSTNSTIRSSGIIIPESSFGSVGGSYTLSFDVTSWLGASNNSGLVRIWTGSNYDAIGGGPKTLILDTLSATLTPQGGATASLLASTTFQSTGSKTVTFNYSGSGVVALFFGATTSGFPFPEVKYDNISISQTAAAVIPEPSVMAFAAVIASASCFVRRRKA